MKRAKKTARTLVAFTLLICLAMSLTSCFNLNAKVRLDGGYGGVLSLDYKILGGLSALFSSTEGEPAMVYSSPEQFFNAVKKVPGIHLLQYNNVSNGIVNHITAKVRFNSVQSLSRFLMIPITLKTIKDGLQISATLAPRDSKAKKLYTPYYRKVLLERFASYKWTLSFRAPRVVISVKGGKKIPTDNQLAFFSASLGTIITAAPPIKWQIVF